MPALIQQRKLQPGRYIVAQMLRSLLASQHVTAHLGPEAPYSGPANFFPGSSSETWRAIPEFVPSQRTFASYLVVPLERNFHPGGARSNFYE